MPIKAVHKADIFENMERPTLILHGVNTLGIMGAGIAKQIKNRYPYVFENYQEACKKFGNSNIGTIQVISEDDDKLVIVNGFTQLVLGQAKLEYVEAVLKDMDETFLFFADDYEFRTVKIGCGLGNLSWDDVKPLFDATELDWEIYEL